MKGTSGGGHAVLLTKVYSWFKRVGTAVIFIKVGIMKNAGALQFGEVALAPGKAKEKQWNGSNDLD